MDLPTAVRTLRVKKAIVQSIFPPLPEFKALRNHQVAAPEFRKRRIVPLILCFQR